MIQGVQKHNRIYIYIYIGYRDKDTGGTVA